MRPIDGFDLVAPGLLVGRGARYVLWRVALGRWDVVAPDGSEVAAGVRGVDEATRAATKHVRRDR